MEELIAQRTQWWQSRQLICLANNAGQRGENSEETISYNEVCNRLNRAMNGDVEWLKEDAVHQIQSFWRGRIERRRVKELRIAQREAVMHIQKISRGHRVRREFLLAQKMKLAAVKIQSVFRGRPHRRAFQIQVGAALRIQRILRGKWARNAVQERRTQKQAAISIQRMYRGRLGRALARRVKEVKEAAAVLVEEETIARKGSKRAGRRKSVEKSGRRQSADRSRNHLAIPTGKGSKRRGSASASSSTKHQQDPSPRRRSLQSSNSTLDSFSEIDLPSRNLTSTSLLSMNSDLQPRVLTSNSLLSARSRDEDSESPVSSRASSRQGSKTRHVKKKSPAAKSSSGRRGSHSKKKTDKSPRSNSHDPRDPSK